MENLGTLNIITNGDFEINLIDFFLELNLIILNDLHVGVFFDAFTRFFAISAP